MVMYVEVILELVVKNMILDQYHQLETNCHGIFENEEKYAIAKYRVTYDLLEEDCKDEN